MGLRGTTLTAVAATMLAAAGAPATAGPATAPLTAAPLTVAPLAGMANPAPETTGYYYTVANSRETLWDIAGRFLGDPDRAGEIFTRNAGRRQPDGGKLVDPGDLRSGWHLALPLDAVGAELEYGPLPTAEPGTPNCDRDDNPPEAARWGRDLLRPEEVWPVADGTGVTVALIGAGVDGSAPELADRVLIGTDIADGAGRGDTTCEGDGTALAGIVAGAGSAAGVDDAAGARAGADGIAPGARILPIRTGTRELAPETAVAALEVAAAAGARVILVGADLDASDPDVLATIDDVVARDVVVVLPAAAGIEPADGLLRVGAVDADGAPTGTPRGAEVDLLAPGVEVATLDGVGTGPRYAAAFVAGAAALVRSAHPTLSATAVTRLLVQAGQAGTADPVAAVRAPLATADLDTVPVAATSRMHTLSRVLAWGSLGIVLTLALAFLAPPPARALARTLAQRRARREGLAARARMSDDDADPFWEPPTATVGSTPVAGHGGRPPEADDPGNHGRGQ